MSASTLGKLSNMGQVLLGAVIATLRNCPHPLNGFIGVRFA